MSSAYSSSLRAFGCFVADREDGTKAALLSIQAIGPEHSASVAFLSTQRFAHTTLAVGSDQSWVGCRGQTSDGPAEKDGFIDVGRPWPVCPPRCPTVVGLRGDPSGPLM